MHFKGVNLLIVLSCAVAAMVVGFAWYSPLLFARPWMKAMGIDPDDKAKLAEMQKSAGPSYAASFVSAMVSAFVLGKIILMSTVTSPLYGMKMAFAVWLGFVTTVQLTAVLFAKQPWSLYFINTGYQLVCYLAVGAILTKWM
jgi:hypothetical protein